MFIKIEKLYQYLTASIRVMKLKEFAKSFSKSDIVLLCPIYAAGEKKNLNFNQIKFKINFNIFKNSGNNY